jgi:hypothetical protein
MAAQAAPRMAHPGATPGDSEGAAEEAALGAALGIVMRTAPAAAPIEALILQFLAWVDSQRPTYTEVLDAWQSSCPRLSVWEDVQIAGLVMFDGTRARHVLLTDAGRAHLRSASTPFAP